MRLLDESIQQKRAEVMSPLTAEAAVVLAVDVLAGVEHVVTAQIAH